MVEVRLLAELGRRVDIHLVAAVRALADLAGRPNRLRVERLGRLIDVRPLQLGLRLRRSRAEREAEDSGERQPSCVHSHVPHLPLIVRVAGLPSVRGDRNPGSPGLLKTRSGKP